MGVLNEKRCKKNTNKRFRIISICFYKKNESIFYKKYENQLQTPKTPAPQHLRPV